MTNIPTEELPLLRVRLHRFSSLDAFVQGYARLVGRRGVLLPSREPTPVGTRLRFLVALGDPDAGPALEGVGEVFRVETDRQGAPRALMVAVESFTEETRSTYDRLLETKRALGLKVSAEHVAVPGPAPLPSPEPMAESESASRPPEDCPPAAGIPSPVPAEVTEHEVAAEARASTDEAPAAEALLERKGATLSELTESASEPLAIRPTEQPTLRSEVTGPVFTVSHMTGPQEIPIDLFGDDDLDSSFDSLFGGSTTTGGEEMQGPGAAPDYAQEPGEEPSLMDSTLTQPTSERPTQIHEEEAQGSSRTLEDTPVAGVSSISSGDRSALLHRIQERLTTGRTPAISSDPAQDHDEPSPVPDISTSPASLSASPMAEISPPEAPQPSARESRPSGSRAAIEALLREADEEESQSAQVLRSLDARHGMATSDQPAVPPAEDDDEDTLDLGAFDRGDALPLHATADTSEAPASQDALTMMTDADGPAEEDGPLHEALPEEGDLADEEPAPSRKGFFAKLFGRK